MFEPLTPRRDTNRGQAGLIGALLMFGLIVVVLVLLQVTAVPVWNGNLEFEHNDRVQEDIQNVDTAISQTVDSGDERPVTVRLGVQYPERPFLFNPADTAGELRTTDPEEIRVTNAEVVGVDNYWSATETFQTRALRYRPNYNEYDRAPTTVYEHGQVYNRFDDGTVRPLANSPVVNGRRISLVALSAPTSESSTGTRSLVVTPTSAPTQTVQVTSRSTDPLVVELPTLLDESQWTERLGDEVDSGSVGTDDDADRYIASLDVVETADEPYDTLVLRFEPGTTYDLQMGAAAVGNAPAEPPAYVTDLGAPQTTVRPGETVRLTFQVRDRFNNPVSGTPVTFPALSTGDGTVTAVDTVSDRNGEAVVAYTAPASPPTSGSVNVTATAAGSTASTTVYVGDSTTTTDFGDPSLVNPPPDSGGVYVTRTALITTGQGPNAKTDALKVCLRNAGSRRSFSTARLIAATGEQFSPNSASLYSTGQSNSKTLTPHGPFTDISGVVAPVNTGDTRAITLEFDDEFSTGSSKGDIVQFAIVYKRGTITETMTYELLTESRTFASGNAC